MIGSLRHFYILINLICYLNIFSLLLLNDIFLEIIVIVVLMISLEYKLLSSVTCRNLLKIITLKLLRSTQHLDISCFLPILFILFKMWFSGHFISLYLSFQPRVTIDLFPGNPILRLLDQQLLQKIIEIWREKLNFGCFACFRQWGDIVETARNERRQHCLCRLFRWPKN